MSKHDKCLSLKSFDPPSLHKGYVRDRHGVQLRGLQVAVGGRFFGLRACCSFFELGLILGCPRKRPGDYVKRALCKKKHEATL